jgi:hypothetical protein
MFVFPPMKQNSNAWFSMPCVDAPDEKKAEVQGPSTILEPPLECALTGSGRPYWSHAILLLAPQHES